MVLKLSKRLYLYTHTDDTPTNIEKKLISQDVIKKKKHRGKISQRFALREIIKQHQILNNKIERT